MPAETIGAALPRTPEATQRPAESNAGVIAEAPEDGNLLRRLEATSASEGPRQEDSNPDQAQREPVLLQNLRSSAQLKSIYPSPVPSLPAPLVPIREVPEPEFESAIDTNPILDDIENKRTEGTNSVQRDEAPNAFESRDGTSADSASSDVISIERADAPVSVNTSSREDIAPEPDTEPVVSGRLNAGSERALQSIVLAQAKDKPPVEAPDSDSSGRIVSFSS